MAVLIRVLLVEDNPGDVAMLREVLSNPTLVEQFVLLHDETLQGEIGRLKTESFDVILLDLNLPDSASMDTVRRMRKAATDMPIVVLTSTEDTAMGVEAVGMGVQEYLVKGTVDSQAFARSIRYAIERNRLEVELRRANRRLEQLVQERTEELERSLIVLGEESVEHRHAEETLKSVKERFNAMTDAIADVMPDVFMMLSPDLSEVIYCNRAYQKVWGRPRQALFAEPRLWIDSIHPDDQAVVVQALGAWVKQAALSRHGRASSGELTSAGESSVPRSGQGRESSAAAGSANEEPLAGPVLNFRVVRPDGAVSRVRCRMLAARDESGGLRHVCGLVEDITQQWTEGGPAQDAIVSVGLDGTIKAWTSPAEAMFGLSASDVVGKPFTVLLASWNRLSANGRPTTPPGPKPGWSLGASLKRLVGRRTP